MQQIRTIIRLSMLSFLLFALSFSENLFGDNNNKSISNDIYVITYKGNVYGYDWETLSLNSEINIGPDPRNIIFSNDGQIIFISSCSSNTISIIDANTNLLIKTIAIDGEPNGITFVPHLNRIYD